MRINRFHEHLLAEDPAYAAAAQEVDLAQSLADRIVETRLALGFTQAQVAQMARATQATISELETGIGNPTLDTIERVFAALTLCAEIAVKVPYRSPAELAREVYDLLDVQSPVEPTVDDDSDGEVVVHDSAHAGNSELALAA